MGCQNTRYGHFWVKKWIFSGQMYDAKKFLADIYGILLRNNGRLWDGFESFNGHFWVLITFSKKSDSFFVDKLRI